MPDRFWEPSSQLEVGICSMAIDGEAESGDAHVVAFFDGGAVIAVIDGLGHGPSAAHAARIAAKVFDDHPQAEVAELLERCHRKLRATRGVAMTVAALDFAAETMSWAGIGNVEARLFRAPSNPAERAPFPPASECVLLWGGIVGYRLPVIKAAEVSIGKGDLLILATDGISSMFGDSVIPWDPPQRTTERIMHLHRKQDDALVLAARYLGRGN